MAIGREHMPMARALPFCLFLSPAGKFIHGTAGRRTAETFRADLEKVIQSGIHQT